MCKTQGYSGGSIAPKLGDFMTAAGVRLFPGYGGTEFGSPTYPFPRKGDELEWAYMEFDSRTNVRWVPQGDGTYECQFLVGAPRLYSVRQFLTGRD